MKLLQLIFFTLVFGYCLVVNAQIQFESKDKEILDELLSSHAKKKDRTTAELVVSVGKSFLHTPYTAHTLETEKEQLVINLRELDCTTYAENCMAIARTIKSGINSFHKFQYELTQIRYRNGKINEYPSRLHYFSDWIYENNNKGLVKDVTRKIGNIEYENRVDFMSKHPDSYKQLKDNQEHVTIIAKQEEKISARNTYFLPKEKLADFENQLLEGDIVGITTSVKGLDITHVGIVVKINGRLHLMHASSKAEKVVISENTLQEYLLKRKSATGIMVARPL